jgi:hypothetical protein
MLDEAKYLDFDRKQRRDNMFSSLLSNLTSQSTCTYHTHTAHADEIAIIFSMIITTTDDECKNF